MRRESSSMRRLFWLFWRSRTLGLGIEARSEAGSAVAMGKAPDMAGVWGGITSLVLEALFGEVRSGSMVVSSSSSSRLGEVLPHNKAFAGEKFSPGLLVRNSCRWLLGELSLCLRRLGYRPGKMWWW